jgi:hypothetical protein
MNVPWGHPCLARLAGAASTPVDLSDLVNMAHAHPLAQTTALWTTELLVSIQELTEATTAIMETLPVMIIAASITATITMMTTGAATTDVITTETTVVKDNNSATNRSP